MKKFITVMGVLQLLSVVVSVFQDDYSHATFSLILAFLLLSSVDNM